VALLDLRLRSGYLFLAAMFAHVILISAQVNSRKGVPVLEEVTFGTFSEVQRGLFSGISVIRNVWDGYVGLRNVRSENEQLKQQLAVAEVELQQQRALADRSRGLEQLLDLRDRVTLKTAAAEIIAVGSTPEFQTVTIDRGSRDGLARDMAVIAPAGVVGRVVLPSPRNAKVQLLIDRNAAAGALIERSRAQGVVIGGGDSRLRLEYVSEVADVAEGDAVVTSGIDGIYPKGLVIGKVTGVERSGGAYRLITVEPAVNFSSLEEVLVVLSPSPEPEPVEVEAPKAKAKPKGNAQ
jgi:rod shape-determining protein MreC